MSYNIINTYKFLINKLDYDLKILGNEDFKINSALNDIRKIMDDILPNYTKLVSVLNKSKGMQCNDRKTNYAAYYTCIFRKVFIRVLR